MNHSLNACEGDEEVGLALLPHDGHAVIVQLTVVPRPTNKGRGQHHGAANPMS